MENTSDNTTRETDAYPDTKREVEIHTANRTKHIKVDFFILFAYTEIVGTWGDFSPRSLSTYRFLRCLRGLRGAVLSFLIVCIKAIVAITFDQTTSQSLVSKGVHSFPLVCLYYTT